jgi:ribosome maturation factor RimP
MNIESQIQAIEERVKALISAEPELFLVEIRIKPTNNIKVYIDGNHGVSVDRLFNITKLQAAGRRGNVSGGIFP